MTTTHTHHQFGEDIPCDLPDTYEAHYGPKAYALIPCIDCATTVRKLTSCNPDKVRCPACGFKAIVE